MFRFSTAVLCLSLSAAAAQAAAPSQLIGKSVVVTWGESRMQKWPGDQNLRSATRQGELKVYVSPAGKIFNRLSMRGGRNSGSSEQVAGEGSDQFENRVVNFQGRSMIQATPMVGGVRRIAVEFNDSFSGCTANVLTGMESGGKKIVMKSLGGGQPFEIHSIQTNGVACSIQSGNVFGQ